MNVRIKEQDLRFKISEEELNALLSGDVLETKAQIIDKKLVVIIDPKGKGDDFSPKLVSDQDEVCLQLLISREKLQKLSDMGRSKNGLEAHNEGLSVSLQVDIRADSRKRIKK